MRADVSHQSAVHRAQRSVELRLELAVHWLVYVAVNTGLVIAAGGFSGAGWRLAGWGVGLLVHTLYVVADADRLQPRLVQPDLARERLR